MFGLDWSEIGLIVVVALIFIGPKDMPVAIRGITQAIRKMRRMAGEFQHHVDDMMREADLGDVKTSIDELRSLKIRNLVTRAVDPQGSLKGAFDDPFRAHPVAPVMTPLDQVTVPPRAEPPHPPAETATAPAAAATAVAAQPAAPRDETTGA